MVSNRCKLAVKEELKKLGLHFSIVDLGEVDVMENISTERREQLKVNLINIGLELIDDTRAILIEKIKNTIIETIHHTDDPIKINFSHYLSEILNHDYAYLSNLFSEVQGTTIEQFIISHKIEKVKELLTYGEFTLTEVSYKLNYSSVAHLSSQFKKVAGLSPSQFKLLKIKRRKAIEKIGSSSEEALDEIKTKNKVKIFLVDDDEVFLKLLEIKFFECVDFVVETFTTGELCIDNLSHNPDIIISDYHLNSIIKNAMNGLETLDKIKSINAAIPVIILSSQDQIDVAVNCLHHNAVDYVVKNETTFLRLQKIITDILSYQKKENQLNWFEDRM
jgi:YesN/AraC family two-component response regulator